MLGHMELSPSRGTRLANSCLGVVPAVVCTAYAVSATGPWPRVAALLAFLASAAVAVRGYRLGVTCVNTDVTVRGYLRTRVIPRDSITAITDFPAVRWTAPNGRKRWTPISALMTSSREPVRITEAKEDALAQLRQWVTRPKKRRRRRR
jgi:hypothetical protein